MDARRTLGRTGEELAAELFAKLGFAILDRNWRCRSGELDLVVGRGDLLVFCEVKTRTSDYWAGRPRRSASRSRRGSAGLPPPG